MKMSLRVAMPAVASAVGVSAAFWLPEAMVRPDPAAAPEAITVARRSRAGQLVDSNVYNSRSD